ncbi:MAG: peptidylprolyl isomerase [Planctomycetaceae bacterium]
MQISANKVVLVDFTLKDDHGEVLDTSVDDEPMAYLHGVGSILPGLEQALEGKSVGDKFQIRVDPELGFGERDETLKSVVPREQFEEFPDLAAGMQFQVPMNGEETIVTVVDADEDSVTLDANHELAGVVLHFDVVVRDVRDATADEIAHGHAHGAGGHHH